MLILLVNPNFMVLPFMPYLNSRFEGHKSLVRPSITGVVAVVKNSEFKGCRKNSFVFWFDEIKCVEK
jgi:hypothetical protein